MTKVQLIEENEELIDTLVEANDLIEAYDIKKAKKVIEKTLGHYDLGDDDDEEGEDEEGEDEEEDGEEE